MKYFFGILLVAGGLVGAYFAVKGIFWQQKAMTKFVETPALVVQTGISSSRGRRSTTYYPEITYEYRVNGEPHRSTQIFPYRQGSSSQSWAQGIIGRYEARRFALEPDASNAKAYVNPDDPDDAILIREYMFNPYGGTMAAFAAVLLGVAAMFTGSFSAGRTTMAALALDDSGWKLLLPKENLKDRLKNATVWLIGTSVITLLPGAHWFVAAGTVTPGSGILLSAGGVCMVIFLVATLRRWSVARVLSDARVRVNPAPVPRGTPLRFEVEADAYLPVDVTAGLVQVVCVETYKTNNKNQVGTRTHRETEVQIAAPGTVHAGQTVAGVGEVLLTAAEWPATSPAGMKELPRYGYEVRVSIKLRGRADYLGVFPLQVE